MSDGQKIVALPNGHNIAFPDSMKDEDISTAIQKNYPEYGSSGGVLPAHESTIKPEEQEQPDIPLMTMAGHALMNAVPSAVNMGSNLLSAIKDPAKFVSGLGDIITGAIDKSGLGVKPDHPDYKGKAFEDFANNYKDAYGGYRNIKNTIANDPARVLMDVASVASGAGAGLNAAGEAAEIPSIVDAGNIASKVGEVTDPINAAGKVINKVGDLGADILGSTTGKGAIPIREGFNAARGGIADASTTGKAFTDEMRNPNNTGASIVNDAQDALSQLYDKRTATYESNLKDLENAVKAKTQQARTASNQSSEMPDWITSGKNPPSENPFGLSTQGLKNTFTKTIKNSLGGDFSAANADESLDAIAKKRPALPIEDIRTLKDLIYNHGDMTPTGMLQLRRAIDDFRVGTQNPSAVDNVFNNLVQKLRGNLSDYVHSKVPETIPLDKNYSESTEFLKEVQKDLSLGDNKTANQALQKLSSAMRKNNGLRLDMIKQLQETSGDENIIPKLAGRSLNTITPDIHRSVLVNLAHATKALPFLSPRAVGEFVNILGKARGAADVVGDAIPSGTGKAMYQAGRASNVNMNNVKSRIQNKISNNIPLSLAERNIVRMNFPELSDSTK